MKNLTPELIAKAKAEHKEKIGDGYVCGLPDGLSPQLQPKCIEK